MSLNKIIRENLQAEIAKARLDTDTNPTEKQKEAGNYRKGHVRIQGMSISIENPKGSYRRGVSKDGKEWKTLMHNDYGYFLSTVGKDGDAIDVFIGPDPESTTVYAVDQFLNGEFDETKVMLGFHSAEEAKRAYLSNYSKDWKGFKYITEVGMGEFKKWLYDGYRQRKPFAKYKSLIHESQTMEKQKITLTESQVRDIVRESIRRSLLEQGWGDEYKNMVDAQAYDTYRNQGFRKRGLDVLTGKRPQKPAGYVRNEPMDDRAERYVKAFNDEHGLGTRIDYRDSDGYKTGESYHSKMRYAKDTHEPVLSQTTNDGNIINQMRKAFDDRGNETEWGISAPYDDNGYTGEYKGNNPDILNRQNKFNNMRREVSDTIKNARGVRSEAKDYNPPKDVAAAVRKGNRDADIEDHGKPTAFRSTKTKNKKVYNRKTKHRDRPY